MDLTCWDRMFGLPQGGGRGFGRFYHKRHGKSKDGTTQKSSSKPFEFLFLKESKFPRNVFENGNLEERFLTTKHQGCKGCKKKFKALAKGKSF